NLSRSEKIDSHEPPLVAILEVEHLQEPRNKKMQAMKRMLLFLLAPLSLCASEFPVPYNSEPDKSKPMSATEAAAKLRLPPGFKATVFAAEPDVQNPIAMAWDARGRLWVAENYTYAEGGKKFDLNLRDRILIFEDKDGDGHFDARKVFTDELQMLTSIEIGHGGVWVICPPKLCFIPDRNGDDLPDGAPEVVLDGFTGSPDMHHTFAIREDRKSTRLNSSHQIISYAVFCLKQQKHQIERTI